MVDVLARQLALEALVERIRQIGPPNWAQIYAAFEAKQVDDEPSFTWLMLGVVNRGDRWGFGQFDQDEQVYDLAMAYRDACGEQAWTTLELKVDYDGEFHADQAYEPVPPGENFAPALLDRLQTYNQTWIAEHGPAPHAGTR